MATALNRLLLLVEGINVVLLLGVIVVVLGQVVARYFLNVSASGSEEAARYLLIALVMLGASTAVRNDSHMAVTYFASLHGPRVQRAMRILCELCILAVGLLLLVKGFELAQRTMLQTSPALRISRGYVASALPLGGALILAAILYRRLKGAQTHSGDRP
jgi:TRAP-type transport system small permease protein